MFELREYQRKAVNELLQSFSAMLARAETKKICVFQAPTGSGKTLAFSIPVFEILLRYDLHLKMHEIGALIIAPAR